MRVTLACLVVLAAPVAGAIAAPVPKSKDDPVPAVTKEHIADSQRKLKSIALGIIAYSDEANGKMPIDITDKNGKSLLSWRVAILPYLDEEKLYKEFKLNEPWDSEHNKKLAEQMPKVFAPVRVKGKAGETFYQVFSGPGALFGPKKKPTYPASITDGTSNTVLVVEAGESAIWSKPADLPFDEEKPLPKLGGLFAGELNVALCDGSVMHIKKDFDADEMRRLITPASGDIIDFDKLKQ